MHAETALLIWLSVALLPWLPSCPARISASDLPPLPPRGLNATGVQGQPQEHQSQRNQSLGANSNAVQGPEKARGMPPISTGDHLPIARIANCTFSPDGCLRISRGNGSTESARNRNLAEDETNPDADLQDGGAPEVPLPIRSEEQPESRRVEEEDPVPGLNRIEAPGYAVARDEAGPKASLSSHPITSGGNKSRGAPPGGGLLMAAPSSSSSPGFVSRASGRSIGGKPNEANHVFSSVASEESSDSIDSFDSRKVMETAADRKVSSTSSWRVQRPSPGDNTSEGGEDDGYHGEAEDEEADEDVERGGWDHHGSKSTLEYFPSEDTTSRMDDLRYHFKEFTRMEFGEREAPESKRSFAIVENATRVRFSSSNVVSESYDSESSEDESIRATTASASTLPTVERGSHLTASPIDGVESEMGHEEHSEGHEDIEDEELEELLEGDSLGTIAPGLERNAGDLEADTGESSLVSAHVPLTESPVSPTTHSKGGAVSKTDAHFTPKDEIPASSTVNYNTGIDLSARKTSETSTTARDTVSLTVMNSGKKEQTMESITVDGRSSLSTAAMPSTTARSPQHWSSSNIRASSTTESSIKNEVTYNENFTGSVYDLKANISLTTPMSIRTTSAPSISTQGHVNEAVTIGKMITTHPTPLNSSVSASENASSMATTKHDSEPSYSTTTTITYEKGTAKSKSIAVEESTAKNMYGLNSTTIWVTSMPEQTSPSLNTEVSQTETHAAEFQPTQTQPTVAQPTQAQPTQAQPTEAQPTEAQTTEAQPTQTQPTQTEPTQTQLTQTEPTQTQPTQTEPTQTQPTQTEPPQTQPTQTEPTQTQPTQTEPTQTQPTEPTSSTLFTVAEHTRASDLVIESMSSTMEDNGLSMESSHSTTATYFNSATQEVTTSITENYTSVEETNSTAAMVTIPITPTTGNNVTQTTTQEMSTVSAITESSETPLDNSISIRPDEENDSKVPLVTLVQDGDSDATASHSDTRRNQTSNEKQRPTAPAVGTTSAEGVTSSPLSTTRDSSPSSNNPKSTSSPQTIETNLSTVKGKETVFGGEERNEQAIRAYPAYVRLWMEISWGEICREQLKTSLKESVAQYLSKATHRNVPIDRVILLNFEESCLDSMQGEMKSLSVPVYFCILAMAEKEHFERSTNRSGETEGGGGRGGGGDEEEDKVIVHCDSVLTELFPHLWTQATQPLVEPLVHVKEVDLVRSKWGVEDGLEFPQNSTEDNTSVFAAIGISCVAAVCLLLIAALLIVMRRRQRRFNYGQRCTPVSLDAYSLDSVSVREGSRRGRGQPRNGDAAGRGPRKADGGPNDWRASKRSYGNPAFEDDDGEEMLLSKPLNFAALANAAINEDGALADEFALIPKRFHKRTLRRKSRSKVKDPSSAAERGEANESNEEGEEIPEGAEEKNRYANVVPLRSTRVKLSPKGSSLSTYINANYVRGPKNEEKFYIACQAPLTSTIEDFWRMVWEQQSKVILMLTALVENGAEKCADYLPPSEVLDCHRLFGDYQVTLKKREVREKYIVSSLQLKDMESNLWREVTHLWFLGWPATGVPEEPSQIIAFLIEARPYIQSNAGPSVVHCSPGTGRTGTVIAIDVCIREFEQSRTVDVPRVVQQLRRDREGAVQTPQQYSFIYQSLSLYATKLTGGAMDSF